MAKEEPNLNIQTVGPPGIGRASNVRRHSHSRWPPPPAFFLLKKGGPAFDSRAATKIKTTLLRLF
jgi:hypothetical protein